MTNSKTSWTKETLRDYFLRAIVTDIHDTASKWSDGVRDAAHDEHPNQLRDRLIELQIGVVVSMFSLIDGSRGPTSWPGIKLVNGETGKSLSNELCWELSRMELTVIEEDDVDIQD